MSRYYLAYGSNLTLDRCDSDAYALVVGKGVIKDYRLLFKGSKTGSYLTMKRPKGMRFLLQSGK